ncbi:MAG: tRNA pseudouridine(38-40) synthase TruA [Methanomicrobiales archaeon]|nr:tRNA pseudouridine(38-40) synthase TruA [Methanomicrobiales archaeon]
MAEDTKDNPVRPAPVRLAFRVSYLGSRFFGSQMQESSRTVEGEFVAACQRLSLFEDWREAGFCFAGRTDRGVHACGQVAAFSTLVPERAVNTINTRLPPDCWCTGFAEVPPEFHPRYDARSRTYRYYYPAPPADIAAMNRASALFIGTHNFTNFARVRDKNPFRKVLFCAVQKEDEFVFFEVTAESFLWHQVRSMATALLRVGNGEAPEDSVRELLEGPAERPLQPAPAEGLILWDTDVGISWTPLEARERSRKFLDHSRNHHALMEKVCGTLLTR